MIKELKLTGLSGSVAGQIVSVPTPGLRHSGGGLCSSRLTGAAAASLASTAVNGSTHLNRKTGENVFRDDLLSVNIQNGPLSSTKSHHWLFDGPS